jgi:hypothetical protein
VSSSQPIAHEVPPLLRGIFFHDERGQWLRWDTKKIWGLPTPVTSLPADQLWWHLKLPIWASRPPTHRFDLSPAEVLARPEDHTKHWDRIQTVNVGFALELFENFGRWVIMDGYHRLAKHRLLGTMRIDVRLHERACLPLVMDVD